MAGKKQDKYTENSIHLKSNPASATTKDWGDCLDLENEDKK